MEPQRSGPNENFYQNLLQKEPHRNSENAVRIFGGSAWASKLADMLSAVDNIFVTFVLQKSHVTVCSHTTYFLIGFLVPDRISVGEW